MHQRSQSRVRHASVTAEPSDWRTSVTKSELDGSETYIAKVDSKNRIPNAIGAGEPATLIIRCKDSLETYVTWPPYIGNETVGVRWRLDDNAIQEETWNSSQDGTATFVTSPYQFLKSMLRAKKFVVQVSPFQKSAVEAVFSVSTSAKPIAEAEKRCPEPPPPMVEFKYGNQSYLGPLPHPPNFMGKNQPRAGLPPKQEHH
jgi:Type VI secretion system VasI, EvfG, VC_A0118